MAAIDLTEARLHAGRRDADDPGLPMRPLALRRPGMAPQEVAGRAAGLRFGDPLASRRRRRRGAG